ncbi:MAG TPA: hypothetical protein VG963_00025, partial [Polyangiaceae bacterium]|nr:hypothetical protein [Polyangiaceae bacterium]
VESIVKASPVGTVVPPLVPAVPLELPAVPVPPPLPAVEVLALPALPAVPVWPVVPAAPGVVRGVPPSLEQASAPLTNAIKPREQESFI